MSDDGTMWKDVLCQALGPANDYARRMQERYRVTDRNDRYGIDHTLNIISQDVEHHQPGVPRRCGTPSRPGWDANTL